MDLPITVADPGEHEAEAEQREHKHHRDDQRLPDLERFHGRLPSKVTDTKNLVSTSSSRL